MSVIAEKEAVAFLQPVCRLPQEAHYCKRFRAISPPLRASHSKKCFLLELEPDVRIMGKNILPLS